MTQPAAARRPMRSVAAIAVAFVVVAAISLGTDQVLHMLQVYPPWGQPMFDPRLNALALSYRLVYGVLGGYITARLAPHHPMWHALIGGAIGTLVAGAGAVVTVMRGDLGPAWYPIALAVSAVPTSWGGARLFERRAARRT